MTARPWLIVDGYNVIGADARLQSLARRDVDAARARLVTLVATYAIGRHRAVIVFDGGADPRSTGAPHGVAGVTVIFSAAGEDADTVIEALAMRARERGEEARVVTSDAATQWTVMGSGISRVPSRVFAADLDESDDEWREHTPSGSQRTTIGDRVPDDVRELLSRWARGG